MVIVHVYVNIYIYTSMYIYICILDYIGLYWYTCKNTCKNKLSMCDVSLAIWGSVDS